MKKWYLIKTKPRQENTAIINLENQEYTTYCPVAKINKKNVVLFPGYVFIYLDLCSIIERLIRFSVLLIPMHVKLIY